MKKNVLRAVTGFALLAAAIVTTGCGLGVSADTTKSTGAGGTSSTKSTRMR